MELELGDGVRRHSRTGRIERSILTGRQEKERFSPRWLFRGENWLRSEGHRTFYLWERGDRIEDTVKARGCLNLALEAQSFKFGVQQVKMERMLSQPYGSTNRPRVPSRRVGFF